MRSPRLRSSLIIAAGLALAGCGTIPPSAPTNGAPSPSGSSTGTTQTSPGPVDTPGPSTTTGGADCAYTPTGDAGKPVNLPPTTGVQKTGTVTYALKLPNGTVKITMDRRKTPCTINSFISLADQGFYNDTPCHRLADSGIFILQCGDPTGTGTGGPGYEFADELTGNEQYGRGVVAMANSGPDTNGSQFFLVWDVSPLGPNYTVFGTMDKAGRDVVAAIASQGQDGSNPDGTGKPNAPATIAGITKA